MKSSTIIGLIVGFGSIFGAYLLEDGEFSSLFLISPMLIVFGGTLAAAIIGTSLEQVSKIPQYMSVATFPRRENLNDIIDIVVRFSALARKNGIISIERRLKEVEHPFLRKIFQLAIDGADPESLRASAETELAFISARHQANIRLFTKMGGYSPTMGIIGTVMGLISTLAAAGSDPNELIHHIATAFIATMWGILMANLVWLPVADKLQTLHNEELVTLKVIIEGACDVQTGESPIVIRSKLAAAMPIAEQEAFLNEPIPSISTPVRNRPA